jgi:PAS domain S-box-containing protein
MNNKTILLVEDQMITAMAESKIITDGGYAVVIAKNGTEAIDSIKKNPDISLVLMDINLEQGMDGTETAQEILTIRELPIVFLTSHSEKEMVEKVKNITRYGYVLKHAGEFVLIESISMAYELFESRQQLKKSETKFRKIFEEGLFGITIADKDFKFIDSNPAFCKIAGYEMDELKTMSLSDIATGGKADIADPGKGSYMTELPCRRKNGDFFWSSLLTTALHDDDNKTEYFLAMIQDITERKENEEELLKKQKFIEGLIESMNDGISVINPDGKMIMCNKALCVISGFDRDELIGHYPPFPYRASDGRQSLSGLFSKSSRGECSELEIEFTRKDGERIPILLTPSVMTDDGGKTTCHIVSIKDMSDWKKTEEYMRLLKYSVDVSHNDVCWLDIDGRIVFVNEASCKSLGYSKEELLNMTVFDINPVIDPGTWKSFCEKLRVENFIVNESVHRRKDGTTFPVEISTTYLKFKQKEFFNGITRNISSRNQVYEALKESEERYRMITEMATDYFLKLDVIDGNKDIVVEYASENFKKTTGRNTDDLKRPGVWEKIFHPDDFPSVKIFFRRMLVSGNPDTVECRTILHGKTRWIEIMATPKRYASGKVESIMAAIKDISERKRYEQTLVQNEEKFRDLVENLSEVVFKIDAGGTITYVSPRCEPVTGYKPEEIIGKSYRYIVTETDLPVVDSSYNEVLTGKLGTSEFRFTAKNGSTGWARTSSKPIMENNIVTGVYGIFSDISEKKRSDFALQNSEARLSNAISLAHLGSWEYDVIQDEFTFNDAFYDIFKTTAERVGGYKMSFREYARRFVHPDDNRFILEESRNTIENGDAYSSRQIEHRIIYANGETGYINVRFFVERDDKGNTVRTYGVNQDITEQKNAENKTMKMLEERELLLTEVHHRIKNDMNIICSMLMIQIDSCVDPEIKDVLMETEARINVMFNIYNELYTGKEFDNISLKTYITNLICNIKYIYSDQCFSILDIEIDDIPIGRNISFPVGMIINEFITNSYKYAFTDRKSYDNKIKLAVRKTETGAIFILVRDNGRGLPDNILRNESVGFGMKLINMLTKQINGETRLYNDHGAVLEVFIRTDA